MGIPQVRFSLALVVFVLTPDGRIETIDGGSVGADELPRHLHDARLQPRNPAEPWGGGALEQFLRSQVAWRLPFRAVTSRFRPLMPRITRHGTVALPLWTMGRLGVDDMAIADAHGVQFGALERLARDFGDMSLVLEGQSEFRRAITGDPIVAELLSDSRRERALVESEIARLALDGEIPPVFALLPERFTINQLRDALAAMARIDGGEIEASSTFRRKVGELIKEHALFTPLGEEPSGDARGRPPMAYRFDPRGWQRWLQSKASQSGDHRWLARQMSRDVVRGAMKDAVPKMLRSMDHREIIDRGSGPAGPARSRSDASASPPIPRFAAIPKPSLGSAMPPEPSGDRIARVEEELRVLHENLSRDRAEMQRLLEAMRDSQQRPAALPPIDRSPEADAP